MKELEAIKARVKEMEEEAEKLKEMQKQVEESIMSPTAGQPSCKNPLSVNLEVDLCVSKTICLWLVNKMNPTFSTIKKQNQNKLACMHFCTLH